MLSLVLFISLWMPISSQPVSLEITDVRVLGPSENVGRVEVLYGVAWFPICRFSGLSSDQIWSNREAAVVCRQLGFDGGEAYDEYGDDLGLSSSGSLRVNDVRCDDDDQTLESCYYEILEICQDDIQAAVFCNGETFNGLRLIHNPSNMPHKGRVQMRYFSYVDLKIFWIDICGNNDILDNTFAPVACANLGYRYGTIDELQVDITVTGPFVRLTECDKDICSLELQDDGCTRPVVVSCLVPDGCQDGYTPFQNSCYKVGKTPMNREDAAAACASQGHLVDITSFEEQQFVINLLAESGGGDAWIGLYSEIEGGTLTWSDGSPLLFESWNQREADHMCIRMRENREYNWDDRSCDTFYKYVCEREDNDECGSSPCLNGATCMDEINSYYCHCRRGFEGDNCQTDTDECKSSPCLNGATCVDGINSYNCSCTPGFEGDNCQNDTDECESSPCLNGATCMDEINYYICRCTPGFEGDNCQTGEAEIIHSTPSLSPSTEVNIPIAFSETEGSEVNTGIMFLGGRSRKNVCGLN